jgi:hypothetical protein
MWSSSFGFTQPAYMRYSEKSMPLPFIRLQPYLDQGNSRPIFSPMPLCHDYDLIRPFIARNLPATNTVLHLVNDTFVSSLRWVRVDDLADPHALLCRTHRFALFADSGRAAARLLAEKPRNMRMRFSSTPTRFYRLIRTHWRGPDAGQRLWSNHCFQYVLEAPGDLAIDRTHRVSRLRPKDAQLIARAWPYGRSPEHILRRIQSGPGFCIRRKGAPVAWGLTHEDASMGFLHVVEQYRHQGMARTLTTTLAQSLLRLGVQPFMYIVTGNTASLRLTTSMGFSRAGRFSWFGTGDRGRSRRRRPVRQRPTRAV